MEYQQLDYRFIRIPIGEEGKKYKPKWYYKLCPEGTVPCVRHGNTTVWDSVSAVSCDCCRASATHRMFHWVSRRWCRTFWISLGKREPKLNPTKPEEIAKLRTFQFSLEKAIPKIYYLLCKQQEEHEACKAELSDAMDTMEEHFVNASDGPFFFGDRFSMVG